MRPLRIAIDASRTTIRQRTGTENYALQLIRHLLALESPHHFTLYFRDTPPADLFTPAPNWTAKIIPFPRMWTHLRFAAELWRSRPDISFVPAHTLPRFFRGKAVVTLHDLGYLYFPEAHPPKDWRYLNWSTAYSARRATLILTDAQAGQADLVTHYQIPAEKIIVAYPGVDDSLAPQRDPDSLNRLRSRYKLPDQYLLFLGTLQPRKNIERLVQAFRLWQNESGNKTVHLVLGGKAGWLYEEAWTAGVENVMLTGYIADEDIAALYSHALGLVFPSLYEGFGFPVIEAMRCGIPVLCSHTSSLRELGNDAAILIDPLDIQAIATGIEQLVNNPTLRQTLIEKGHQNAQKFTWQRCAQIALKTLEDAAQ